MITLFELGKCMALGKKVVIGCEEGYVRALDVRIQSRLMRPNIPIARDLNELVMNLVTLIRADSAADVCDESDNGCNCYQVWCSTCN